MTTLTALCEKLFSEQGDFKSSLKDYEQRDAQKILALAIADTMKNKDVLTAEAGTGTGKTFAYLAPALLSGQKTIISTATKTLQDQLFSHDIPILKKILGVASHVVNLKGRNNYVCRYRTKLYATQGSFNEPEVLHDVLFIHDALPRLRVGDKGELPNIREESGAWYYTTATHDNCLGGGCPDYEDCFLVKARKRAMKADVVVINHHLFFADTRLKDEGFGELLPGADVVIFDEAHQLPDVASQFYSVHLSTRQCEQWMNDCVTAWPLARKNDELSVLADSLHDLFNKMHEATGVSGQKQMFEEARRNPSFHEVIQLWDEWFSAMKACLNLKGLEEQSPLTVLSDELTTMHETLLRTKNNASEIHWVEYFKSSMVIHCTPMDIAELFQTLMKRHHAAYIFTSATLTVEHSFETFLAALGMLHSKTLQLSSPFDYKNQALLYLPRGLPDPLDKTYHDCFIKAAIPVIEALEGRTFLLFTSHQALNYVASKIKLMINLPILVQGEESKTVLIQRFKKHGNAVLLGTYTFWEGVDVKGHALSCVIIDKLPFESPTDPVISGKMTYFKQQGRSGFDELLLPNAIVALKQGMGRLIRDMRDKGIFVLMDPRLLSRSYGKTVFSSLPDMSKTRTFSTVNRFIEERLFSHETTDI